MRNFCRRAPQIGVLGSAERGTRALELAGEDGTLVARLGYALVSGCGSAATRVAAERALAAGGQVPSIVPRDDPAPPVWPCTMLVPCGMGDARNLLMALPRDVAIVVDGRAGTKSEVCLAWLHGRTLLPLAGCGGWSGRLEVEPRGERVPSPILPWTSPELLGHRLAELGFQRAE